MKYLYHRIMNDMRGNIIYPLNELKNVYPDIYSERVKKYEGREHVMQEKIPFLNCLWNDAIHLSAVDPREVRRELNLAGRDFNIKGFYKIDPNSLDPKNTIVYLYTSSIPNHALVKEDFIPYTPDIIEKISVLPEETKKYYADAISQGNRPFLWHGVPHVLYKGRIDVSNLEILEIQ